MSLWALRLARSSGRRCGPPQPSSSGSLQICLCQCNQRTFPLYEVVGSSTTVTTALSDGSLRPTFTVIIHRVLMWWHSRSQSLTDLSNLYWVLCGPTSVVLNFELLHKLFKPTDRDKHVIHMIHLSKRRFNDSPYSLSISANLMPMFFCVPTSVQCPTQVQSLKPQNK